MRQKLQIPANSSLSQVVVGRSDFVELAGFFDGDCGNQVFQQFQKLVNGAEQVASGQSEVDWFGGFGVISVAQLQKKGFTMPARIVITLN
jgi:hypothetical protein